MNKFIVHVSETDISLNTGMGRVEYYWEAAIKRAGYGFIHIGPTEIGKIKHKGLFPYKAYAYYKKIKQNVVAIIVHEPAAMFFVNKGIPVFIESHGVERKIWEMTLNENQVKIGFKTKLFYPIWRLLSCDIGLKKADKLLLINNEDKDYVIQKYNRSAKDILVFKNGVRPIDKVGLPSAFTILYNASWIERKGTKTLVDAAKILFDKSVPIRYLLIGTGKDKEAVLNDWPENLRSSVEIVPKYDGADEVNFLARASVVVLPSNFEGQPLSLLQAMAAGKCCIATNSCGQKDFIENDKTGVLFEKYDSAGLAGLIQKCIEEPALIDRIGLAARKSMENRTWEKTSDELVAYLKSSISS